MKKPEKLGWKLLALTVFGLLVGIWYRYDLPCVFRYLTGLPCFTCGMTRAWLCAFRLDLSGAFGLHPMFWSIPIFIIFVIFDGNVFPNRKVNILLPLILLLGMFLVYFARIFGFLGTLSPL